MKRQGWICIQAKNRYSKQDWFCEWTLSYTRRDSIKLLIGEGDSTWAELKSEYGWRCSKVELSITEVGDCKTDRLLENTILSYRQALNAIAVCEDVKVSQHIAKEVLEINK